MKLTLANIYGILALYVYIWKYKTIFSFRPTTILSPTITI